MLSSRTIRSLAVVTMATVALLTPPREAAAQNAEGQACNMGYPFYDCTDTSLLVYMCNAYCPGWLWAVCQDEYLYCSNEPM